MYLNDDEWEALLEPAEKRLQNARLELLGSEEAVKEIKVEIARIILKRRKIAPYNYGQTVLVDFKDSPNTKCLYEGVNREGVRLRLVGSRNRSHKHYSDYSFSIAYKMYPLPDKL